MSFSLFEIVVTILFFLVHVSCIVTLAIQGQYVIFYQTSGIRIRILKIFIGIFGILSVISCFMGFVIGCVLLANDTTWIPLPANIHDYPAVKIYLVSLMVSSAVVVVPAIIGLHKLIQKTKPGPLDTAWLVALVAILALTMLWVLFVFLFRAQYS